VLAGKVVDLVDEQVPAAVRDRSSVKVTK